MFRSSMLMTLLVSIGTFGVPAAAQTPDEQTPAQETVCSPLAEDGVTKGLYGLCVAFCESHDTASEEIPITEADFDALLAEAPSGRILANYNKKKQDSDPDMPCVKIDEPCPCWSADEFNSIDGVSPDTTDVLDFSCASTPVMSTSLINETTAASSAGARNKINRAIFLIRDFSNGTSIKFCEYVNSQVFPAIDIYLEVNDTQAASCLGQITQRCADFGLPL